MEKIGGKGANVSDFIDAAAVLTDYQISKLSVQGYSRTHSLIWVVCVGSSESSEEDSQFLDVDKLSTVTSSNPPLLEDTFCNLLLKPGSLPCAYLVHGRIIILYLLHSGDGASLVPNLLTPILALSTSVLKWAHGEINKPTT